MAFVESMFRGIYASSYDNISHKFSMLGKSGSKSLIDHAQKMAQAKKGSRLGVYSLDIKVISFIMHAVLVLIQ